MSQIFEALRRSRDQDRKGAGHRRTAREDALLATMGFASEALSARRRYTPALLVVLLGVVAWLAWSWYRDLPASSSAEHPTVANAPIQAPVPRTEPRPSSPTAVPTTAPATVTTSAAAPPAAAPPSAPSRTRPAASASRSDPLQLALYYHRAGDFENALLHYRAVLGGDELNAQAHNNLGLLYRDKGLLDDAVRQFQRALLIDARYTTARNNLGVALLGLGRVDEAASELRQVLAQQPRNADAMVNLALAERSSGRPGAAMETLARALAIEPRSAPAHYNLAILYEQAGERGKAMAHYQAFLDHAGTQHAARAAEVRGRLAELGGQ